MRHFLLYGFLVLSVIGAIGTQSALAAEEVYAEHSIFCQAVKTVRMSLSQEGRLFRSADVDIFLTTSYPLYSEGKLILTVTRRGNNWLRFESGESALLDTDRDIFHLRAVPTPANYHFVDEMEIEEVGTFVMTPDMLVALLASDKNTLELRGAFGIERWKIAGSLKHEMRQFLQLADQHFKDTRLRANW